MNAADVGRALAELFKVAIGPTWQGVPIASFVVLAVGGLMYVAMSIDTKKARSPKALAVPRPGWIARRRAAGGLRHPKAGAALGYASATHRVGLSIRELELGGLILGTKGSGKTWALALLIEALAWLGRPCVVLDPKPSRDLAAVVARLGGIIWTIGGPRPWDALPDDPSELANQLVEVLPVDARTKVYRDAARLWVLVAGQALRRQREHPTVARMADLCRPGKLAALLKAQGRLDELPRLSQTEQDGVLSLGTSLSVLARGVAGQSLGAGLDALRLEDAMASGKIVLLQLAAGPYPEETRMLGAWALRAMLRLLRHPSPCVLLCDEFARLGVQGRAALELLALGREFGKAVILATQGPSDLGELGHHALDQAAQDAGWILAFRQGTRDSDTASRLLGVRQAEERSWSTDSRDTREHVRIVEQRIVPASVLEGLPPATAYLRAPATDGRPPRVEPVRMARPSLLGQDIPRIPSIPREEKAGERRDGGMPAEPAQAVRGAVPGPPPSAEPEAVDEDLARVLGRLEREGERDGACRLWPASGVNTDGYAKTTIKGQSMTVHKWLWEREHGPVPRGWTLEHTCHTAARLRGECPGGKCKHRRCCELDHIEAMPKAEHSSRTVHRRGEA
jgi:hypothetical protein